ncbi:MAG TPA: YceI family protein [Chloroflexota bacterium]|nr:YceI family protein [Chloroflexota bacterium]
MSTLAPQTSTRTAWKIDPAHSSVEFRVKHMMVTTVRGRFTGVNGDLYGDLDNPLDGKVDVQIDAASIDTRQEQRDAHLRSADFLDVENYPTITFKSTRVEVLGKDHLHVTGELSIHGVTREVTLDTHINGTGKTPFGTEIVGASATTSINRKDFGLTWNVALETGGWLVGETINIDLEIEAVKQA